MLHRKNLPISLTLVVLMLILVPLAMADGVVAWQQTDTTEPTPDVAEESEAVATPQTQISALFDIPTLELLVNARADLELFATEVLGLERPVGWSGSLDLNNPQLPLLIRLDLELMVAIQFGETVRPRGWVGPVPSIDFDVARDIRVDLEILADETFGLGVRPDGWSVITDFSIYCSDATQTLSELLQRGGLFTPTADPNSPTYCTDLEAESIEFAESFLLSAPEDQSIYTLEVQASFPGVVAVQTEFAVAFSDRFANVSVGVVPLNTPITPVARSYSQFSNMVMVQGDGFLIFMDYTNSTLTESAFRDLPNSDEITTAPFCSADWCNVPQ